MQTLARCTGTDQPAQLYSISRKGQKDNERNSTNWNPAHLAATDRSRTANGSDPAARGVDQVLDLSDANADELARLMIVNGIARGLGVILLPAGILASVGITEMVR